MTLTSYVCCDPFFWDATQGIADLGTLGGGSGDCCQREFAINNAGEVTGTSLTADGVQHAFLGIAA